MRNITTKQLWAALLTAAALFSMTGCAALGDTDTTSYTESTIGIVETTEEYVSQTDYLYIKNEDGTIAISGYTGSDTVVNVPDTVDGLKVTAIGDHAFEANWDIEQVVLPEGITYIGESAFMDCGSLTSVNVPESTDTIRRAAFAGCSAIAEISVPENKQRDYYPDTSEPVIHPVAVIKTRSCTIALSGDIPDPILSRILKEVSHA